MGKPYKSEITSLAETFNWIRTFDVKPLRAFISNSQDSPLIAIGSGGSYTAATLAALLHQQLGNVTKSITPLDYLYSGSELRDAAILLMTAGGRNFDVRSAFKAAAINEPKYLMALCMRTNSPLSEIANDFRYSSVLDLDLPVGPDGFLATSSLIATAVLLLQAYSPFMTSGINLLDYQWSSSEMTANLRSSSQDVLSKNTWSVLYGGWGLPAAIDLESKLTEAALQHTQITDFRNFAHGRHHWLAKRGKDAAVIVIETPEEKQLADKTLKLLPSHIPSCRITTTWTGPIGSLDLLLKVIHFVDLVGEKRGIDPGRPGVPEFGRKIYNLHAAPAFEVAHGPRRISRLESAAIIRKTKWASFIKASAEELVYWRGWYKKITHQLTSQSFTSVVFDYDGTLCDATERFTGPCAEMGKALCRLLRAGITLGIATGRGDSVRNDLRRLLPEQYWPYVHVGYYNGGDIGLLADDRYPKKDAPIRDEMLRVLAQLKSNTRLYSCAKIRTAAAQISIVPLPYFSWTRAKSEVIDCLAHTHDPSIKMVESSHSIDIIPSEVSKVHVVKHCERISGSNGKEGRALRIGDRGEWPGNDFDLLSSPYALSVDTVSPDPNTAWNLSPEGHRGVQATLDYLAATDIENGLLTLSLRAIK